MNKLKEAFLLVAAVLIGTLFISTASALTVSLTSPDDGSITNDNTPDFSFEIADLSGNVTCDLLINGSNYGSEVADTNGTYTITADTALSEGTYTWNVDCEGTSDISYRTLTVDLNGPTISLVDPDDEEVIVGTQRPDFIFNVEDAIDDNIDCDLYIDDSTSSSWATTATSGVDETITLSQDLEWGEHEYYVECVDDSSNSEQSSTINFYIGGLVIKDLDLSDDDVKPGEEVTLDIEIENILDNEDIEDVEVTIENDDLDLDEEETISEIKDGDEETISIEFTIDPDADEDTYTIDVIVKGEDEDGNDHEIRDSIDIDVEKERHELIVEESYFSPSSVECGQNTELTIEIQNIGRSDEDTYITIQNTELGIEERIEEFEIDSGDDSKKSKLITIPEEVEDKVYSFLIKIYYDDGDEQIAASANLDINCEQTTYSARISLDSASLDLSQDEEGEIIANIENTGDEESSFDILLSGASSWSEYTLIPSEVTLTSGESEAVVIHITPNEEVFGERTVILYAKHNGDTLASKSISINIEDIGESGGDVEIISEGENELITGGAILKDLDTEDMALIVAIAIASVLIGVSVITNLRRRKKEE